MLGPGVEPSASDPQGAVEAVKDRVDLLEWRPFDLGMRERNEGVSVVLEGPNPSADNLDVLLRHRLPRQPGCFEGFAVIEIRSDPRDLAVAKIEYLAHRRIDQSAAARSASLDPAENKNLLAAEIAKVLPHHAVLLPGVADLTNVRLDALASPQ